MADQGNAPVAELPAVPAAAAIPLPSVADAKAAATKATESIRNFSASKSGSIIVIVVIGIAVAFITAYALYWVIGKTLVSRSSYLLAESKMPLLGTQVARLKGDKIPNSTSGKRASMSFWIYIYDINKFSGTYRHIMHRGDPADSFDKASPFVRMDPNSNAISITYATTDPALTYAAVPFRRNAASGAVQPASTDFSATLGTTNTDGKWDFVKQTRGITFDYIPLQRWVHVCSVINEDVNGGSITGYLDGELVKTVTASNPAPVACRGAPSVVPTFNIQNVNLDEKGDVYIGGNVSDPVGAGFSGMVSRVEFFNSDLNAADVYENYKKGPVDNVMAKMGLPAYGVQSPVYRIGG